MGLNGISSPPALVCIGRALRSWVLSFYSLSSSSSSSSSKYQQQQLQQLWSYSLIQNVETWMFDQHNEIILKIIKKYSKHIVHKWLIYWKFFKQMIYYNIRGRLTWSKLLVIFDQQIVSNATEYSNGHSPHFMAQWNTYYNCHIFTIILVAFTTGMIKVM